MNGITKYNLKTTALSVAILIVLLSALSYWTASQAGEFGLSSLNPFGILEGVAFSLSFGLGFPIWLSVVTIAVVLVLLFYGFLWIVRKMVK